MKKTTRYVLYFVLGIVLFYSLKREGNEKVLSNVHEYAPVIILTVFALLLFVRSVIEKKNKEKD